MTFIFQITHGIQCTHLLTDCWQNFSQITFLRKQRGEASGLQVLGEFACYRAEFRKGPGTKELGFTIIGGGDSVLDRAGIFVAEILQNGQAAQSAIKPGSSLFLVVLILSGT